MQKFMMILALTCFLMGLLWIGQGLGWINWPQSSFMIDQSKWAVRGGFLCAAGLIMLYLSRHKPS